MDYRRIYEKQYGESKLVNTRQRQFLGLRMLLKKYDWDRYMVAESLVDGGNRLLDIGCGDGYLLLRLKDGFSELYGLDVSPSRLRQAEAEAGEHGSFESSKFTFVEGNADDALPFPDDYFDVVTCLAVIEHVYDVFSLVESIHRVLVPGGYVVAEVPNIAYLKYRVQLMLGKLPVTATPHEWREIGWDAGHIHCFTRRSFCWLFEQEGLKVEKTTGSGFLAGMRNWRPSLLTGNIVVKARKPGK